MIHVKNLCKSFGNFRAVKDLSFHVEKGEIFGFIGPNGAGKTTTIKMLATLLEPDKGIAKIDGHSVLSAPDKVRMAMGYMPDYFGVYEDVTVAEYLDFFALAYKIPRKHRLNIINDCMELTDLRKLSEKLVSSLSKGMKQRLCLAKTLLHDPKVLILDEPAAGLDPRARIEFRSLIKELKNLGKTIFISSHILRELSGLVTSMAIVEQGKLVVTGSVEQISASLAANTVIQIKTFKKLMQQESVEILKKHDDVVNVNIEEESLEVEYKGQDENIYEVIRLLVDNNVPVVEFSKFERNLEDIFMRVTKGEVA